MAEISRYFGDNVGQLRRNRNLSQAQLAKIAGVPRSTIANMETGSGNPSLAILIALSKALRVSIEELLQEPHPDVRHFRYEWLEGAAVGGGIADVTKMLPDPVPGVDMERMEFLKKGTIGGVPHLPGTKEYFSCIYGQVTVRVAGREFKVEAGDVLVFPGDQKHSYENTGRSRSIGVSVILR
jgi:transcriptional regulator with XRE-family HTH domain